MRVRERLKTEIIFFLVNILQYDHFKPKSYLKLIKKYVFSEGEQFPLTRAPLAVWANFAIVRETEVTTPLT